MKITALIPDELMKDVKRLSKGKNTTEALLIVLSEWTAQKKIQALRDKVRKKPLSFSDDFSATKIRNRNRKL